MSVTDSRRRMEDDDDDDDDGDEDLEESGEFGDARRDGNRIPRWEESR